LSGAKGAYTSALSEVLAEILAWKHARFSDFIRGEAAASGESPEDTRVLQRIGQHLVEKQLTYFVTSVLNTAGWRSGDDLVLDGLRHADVFRELKRQVDGSCDIRVAHVALADKAERADRVKRSEGVTDDQFRIYDQDATETQVEETPVYAHLELNGAEPRGELARTIIRRFVGGFTPAPAKDDGEQVSRLEPMTIRTALSDLAQELMREARQFAREVPAGFAQPLADLVRAMNCYYSNLIEGSNATPQEIDLALNGNYEKDQKKRHLQAEAKAHIAVQRWIDAGNLRDQPPMSIAAIVAIHDRFFSEFPDPQYVEDIDQSRRAMVVPGSFRQLHIKVGHHLPPSPGSIPRFMTRFEEVYAAIKDPEQAILALASAHHRLLWIHPFLDGNGRVARLVTDALLGRVLRTYGIWSASRGLAQHQKEYKALLAACDVGRRGDLDGRGHLSESSLGQFSKFFLTTCLEQVRFMRKVMRLDEIEAHIDTWIEASRSFGEADAADAEHWPLQVSAGKILKALLDGGPLSLAECGKLLDLDDNLDIVLAQLRHHGFLRQTGDIISFVLPPHRAERFLPGLFP
jgi:Fic family protein